MGGRIRSVEDVHRAIYSVPFKGRLFACFLLDSRASNEKAFKTIELNKRWIDELSASSRIFTLIPFSTWAEEPDSERGRYMQFERMMIEAELPKLSEEEKEFFKIGTREITANVSLI